MKSLILVCLVLLVPDSFSKEIGNNVKSLKSPTQHDLDLLRLPINLAVVEGQEAILRCAVEPTDGSYNLAWWEYAHSPLGQGISSNEDIGAHPQRDRYSIIHDGEFEYNLRIFPVIMADGGIYQCRETQASPIAKREHSLSLTVLGADPNCTTTMHESGVVFEDSYQTNDCQLDYQGVIIPNMTWTGPGGPGAISQRYIATATHVWAGMQFNATRSMEGSSFVITTEFTGYFLPVPGNTADNVPDYRRTDEFQPLIVQWGPKNMDIQPVKQRYDIGDQLTCTADSNPAATFFWQNLRTNDVIQGNTFTIPSDLQGTNQSMRCDARNFVQGIQYTNIAIQVVDVNPITTTGTTTPPTTTTLAPPVSDCRDLTGGWVSTKPTNGALCIRLDLEENGALKGLMLNDSDTFWVDIVGRAQATKFDQVGFNGIWPAEIGVSSFIGECHRCYGVEELLVHVVTRSKGNVCGTGGEIRYTNEYTFHRSDTVQCPNLPPTIV